jgi:hypothetical protein
MNDARKAQAPVTASLSRPHTLFHEAVLGRIVKRLAFRAHCFASEGVPFALLHESHLGSAVKRLCEALRTPTLPTWRVIPQAIHAQFVRPTQSARTQSNHCTALLGCPRTYGRMARTLSYPGLAWPALADG